MNKSIKAILAYSLGLMVVTHAYAGVTYEIIFPDKEVKRFVLSDNVQAIKIPKSKWICRANKHEKEKVRGVTLQPASIRCELPKAGAGLSLTITCPDIHADVVLPKTLFIDDHSGSYRIMLACE